MNPPGHEAGHGHETGHGHEAGHSQASDRHHAHDLAGDDPEERDPGLARERTTLAWTRTAISFAALGGVELKVNVAAGLVVLAIAPVVWQLGRVTRNDAPKGGKPLIPGPPIVGPARLFLIAVAIIAVALLCLVVAILGRSAPGALR